MQEANPANKYVFYNHEIVMFWECVICAASRNIFIWLIGGEYTFVSSDWALRLKLEIIIANIPGITNFMADFIRSGI